MMWLMSDFKEKRSQQRGLDKHRILCDHFLFGKLSPQQIDRLCSCIRTKSVNRGTTIFAKGDPGSSLFAIGKGSVKISVPSVEGHDAIFNVLGRGAIFGEIALLDGRPRTADAIALTDCELLVIDRRDFMPLLRAEPEIAIQLLEILCSRLRQTTEQAETLMFLNLPRRLARTLLRLVDATADTSEPKIAITQRDLGSIIGITREGTNKQLRSWERNKWVRLHRGYIVIRSIEALASIAESDSESN
jgi:CRP/FNR family cyclic AMP-dependent transcriptional regulator